jgi:hypothetical protein
VFCLAAVAHDRNAEQSEDYSSNIKIAVKMAPAVSQYYVVRQKEWNIMVQHLVDAPSSMQKIFTITGMGGCGKTQLVSYFLQEKGSMYVGLWGALSLLI